MDAMSIAKKVVLVGFEQMQLLDLSGPGAVFDAAARVLKAGGGPGYELLTATPGGEDVRASCGMRIGSDADLGSIDPDAVDTLLVAGGRGRTVADGDPRLVGELPRLAA